MLKRTYMMLLQDEESLRRDAGGMPWDLVKAGSHAHDASKAELLDVQLDIERCCQGLPEEVQARLHRLDSDGNGKVSAAEILHAVHEKNELERINYWLGWVSIGLLLGIFALTFVAASLLQPTDVIDGALAAYGANPKSGRVLQTAEAFQAAPLALAPMLDAQQLERVNHLSVSNLISTTTKQACATCPRSAVIHVDMALKHSDLKAEFIQTGGATVVIDRGLITVFNFSNSEPGPYVACGSVTCSSIRVEGINIDQLQKRAQGLGYLFTGRRGLESFCKRKGLFERQNVGTSLENHNGAHNAKKDADKLHKDGKIEDAKNPDDRRRKKR